MNLFQKIKDALFSTHSNRTLDNTFVYPYSNEKEVKRKQVWENLAKGILFEDTKVLIPWLTPYADLDKIAAQRKDSGDRTNWFLGKHEILDGYTCYIEVMKWISIKNSAPFSEIEEWLGFDYEGNKKFIFLKEKLTDLLGEPTEMQLEKFGDFDLGSISWANKNVSIRLSGIEQFACKYRMYIGLAENKSW